MQFNTKYIFAGDSASEIRKKINYNFDQIISFAVGPDGHQGEKGPAGYAGPAGHPGIKGATGLRGSVWYKQNDAPTSGYPFDLWVDSDTSNYDINVLGTGGWSYSGYSLFTSPYLSTYSGIIGPAGVTDKYAIGIKNGTLNEANTYLVIGDGYASTTGINPNRSKLLVSTEDQTARPVFTFSKTGATSTGVPAFYWRYQGNSASLRYTSNGNLEMSSLLGLTIDSYTARSILYGDHADINSIQDITIGGTGDFYLYSNTTIGVGSNFSITSSNIRLGSTDLISYRPIKIQSTTSSNSGYVYDITKSVPSGSTTSTDGISIISSSTPNASFEFFDYTNSPIFSGKPRGTSASGKHAQIILGSTGGATAGATGGPYLYNVNRIREVRAACTTDTVIPWNLGATPTSSPGIIYNVMDLSSTSLWDSNYMLVSPTSYTYPFSYEVYLKIPTTYNNDLSGVYTNGYNNTYRIFMNDRLQGNTYKINGLVFAYWRKNITGSSYTTTNYYIRFNNTANIECSYIDLTFLGTANTVNANPRLFWKTCDGISGYITLANRFSVGSFASTTPATSASSAAVTGKF